MLRLLLSAALLGAVLSRVDWPALIGQLARLQTGTLLAVFSVNLASHLLLIYRWHFSLKTLRVGVPFAETARCYWVGAYYNLFLPSNVGGDAARALRLYQLTRRPQLAATSSLVDRIAGFLCLTFLAFVGSFLLRARGVPALLPAGVRVAFLTLALGVFLAGGSLGLRARRLVRRYRRSLSLVVATLHFSARVILRHPPLLGVALVCTAGYQVALALTHLLLARDLGVDASLGLLLVFIPMIAVGSMAPVSVNGIGLREVLYLSLFVPVGWSSESVLAVSWVIFGCVLASGIPGLVYEIVAPLREPAPERVNGAGD